MGKKGILVLLSCLVAIIGFNGQLTAGDAGTAYGIVRDSGSGFPADGDFSYTAYLTFNPGETVNRAATDGTGTPSYNAPTGQWIVQLSVFTTWTSGNTLHIDFTDANGPTGVETGSDEGVLVGTNNNFGDSSLPVELSLFEAKAGDSIVLIMWKTESEADNLGFHLYRATDRDGNYARITKELIKSGGNSTSTQEYSYTDKNVRNGVKYFYKLEDVNANGEKTQHGPVEAAPNFGLQLDDTPIPTSFGLAQNFPNPFNPGTLIQYQLPEDRQVRLTIYNLLGQAVRTLVDEHLKAGYKSVYWDGRDNIGREVAAGVYIYEIIAGDFISTKKMLMLR